MSARQQATSHNRLSSLRRIKTRSPSLSTDSRMIVGTRGPPRRRRLTGRGSETILRELELEKRANMRAGVAASGIIGLGIEGVWGGGRILSREQE